MVDNSPSLGYGDIKRLRVANISKTIMYQFKMAIINRRLMISCLNCSPCGQYYHQRLLVSKNLRSDSDLEDQDAGRAQAYLKNAS